MTSDEGIDRLDAICVMLIAIGESCKHLDKITDGKLLARYPSIDWPARADHTAPFHWPWQFQYELDALAIRDRPRKLGDFGFPRGDFASTILYSSVETAKIR
jgi:hypothetical protein